uniref:Homoserine dehydrogenase n=1 Tax=Physcomitrium patens TaxID=3218 RepID=A0A2K1KJT3_PHYPA|nr:hypothetical protein PHYPA_007720 [Physcomitrium patens]
MLLTKVTWKRFMTSTKKLQTLLEIGKELSTFLSDLEADIFNLRAMLRAISIAGYAPETLEDWVVGHGEVWAAKLLAAAVRKASSEHSVCFAVPEKEADTVREALLLKFRKDLDAERLSKVEVVKNCSILAAVGHRMASTPDVSANLFDALSKASINVRAFAQGCSEYNITVVVDQNDAVRALKAVHSRFYHNETSIAVGLVGPGSIGKALLNQFKEQVAILKEDNKVDFRVMGIQNRTKMYLSETAIDLSNWEELLQTKGVPKDIAIFTAHMQSHSLPNAVIVDCTADDDVTGNYYDWLQKGIHIITPNKIANSGPYEQYARLRRLQRQSGIHYFYEGTVGAGLPIISTLRGLIGTGDKILKVEGVLSGTLSYLFNNFNGEKPFSQIVTEAKAEGLTEPNPKDDLTGMDVGRKVTILARECGLRLELDDVKIDEDWMSEDLLSHDTAEKYLEELPKSFDEVIEPGGKKRKQQEKSCDL